MPIRIKPIHDLRPCVLDLDSIKGICALVGQDFNQVRFSAEDGVWEVYDEDVETFIPAISPRDTLDSFTVQADNRDMRRLTSEKSMRITFNKQQAQVKFSGAHDLENWFEHFMIDLKKHLRPPQFRQRLTVMDGFEFFGSFSLALAGLTVNSLSGGKYCQIVLHKRPPNALIENVKANLISNFIWVVIVFIAGIAVTLISLWIYRRYGLNINEWVTPPSIPTPTPHN